MKQFANTDISKELKNKEHFLAPVTVVGVILPSEIPSDDNEKMHFKLSCATGQEYQILESSKMRNLLSLYCWKEVKVVGLIDRAQMTLIPQKVIPKGPDGESSNLIDLSFWKNHNLKRKVITAVNDLVVIPAAVFTLLAS